MKNPNGYGSVYKLSGKRRRPWIVRKTLCYEYVDGKAKRICETIGYYETRPEAIKALADYNADPFDKKAAEMTLKELHDLWIEYKKPLVSVHTFKNYTTGWHVLEPIQDKTLNELKLATFQRCFDTSGKNPPVKQMARVQLSMMYEYAVKHEILKQEKAALPSYIEIGKHTRKERKAFTKEQISKMWEDSDYYRIPLILIYTGLRIGEFLNLTINDIDLENRTIHVRKAKTASGVRVVPIASNILPLLRLQLTSEYICPEYKGEATQDRFRAQLFAPLMDTLGCQMTPHETRHTFITLLTEAGVDSRYIKAMAGHKGSGVTEAVYTHISIETLLNEIDKIC